MTESSTQLYTTIYLIKRYYKDIMNGSQQKLTITRDIHIPQHSTSHILPYNVQIAGFRNTPPDFWKEAKGDEKNQKNLRK